jgi:hypothetical protein
MTVDWSRPLTRVLILKTGERLRTLHDAAELISRQVARASTEGPGRRLALPSEARLGLVRKGRRSP